MKIDLTTNQIDQIKKLLKWTAQQGYSLEVGEETAVEIAKWFGSLINEEMFLDQPYYNAYSWRPLNKK